MSFRQFAKRLLKDEDGATAIEYGLLAALISVGIIAVVGTLGDTLQTTFTDINTELADQGVGGGTGGTTP